MCISLWQHFSAVFNADEYVIIFAAHSKYMVPFLFVFIFLSVPKQADCMQHEHYL